VVERSAGVAMLGGVTVACFDVARCYGLNSMLRIDVADACEGICVGLCMETRMAFTW
jgi:hypothetical protein